MLEVTISTTQIIPLLYVSKYTQLQIRDQIPLMRGMKFAKKSIEELFWQCTILIYCTESFKQMEKALLHNHMVGIKQTNASFSPPIV